ncbi:acetyltransferase, GNAT family [Formosa sp. Hel1_33_131]|uniref:GNAT family N-acetyltransferase n=1 Tax=Formosa sp. Hel1_33_131 TaxID=1336794 RepID=UPI000865B2DC|nr:GNAT family N-acetyltransferase [Formosa sp. Hel1_33_131]AOR27985.1 acetyltransferase, GNAT family [Formosa sp. Hel1_33_131]
MMKFLPSKKEYISLIMQLIGEAQAYLAAQDIEQWQNGYPNEQAILKDILNNESYVVKLEDSNLLATAMFTTKNEPTYKSIEGHWITESDATYGVIHRMAVGEKFRGTGVAKFIFNHCEQTLKQTSIQSMRIDTHEDNLGMQALLKRLGYVFCGVIYLENNDKRLAYEKLIS